MSKWLLLFIWVLYTIWCLRYSIGFIHLKEARSSSCLGGSSLMQITTWAILRSRKVPHPHIRSLFNLHTPWSDRQNSLCGMVLFQLLTIKGSRRCWVSSIEMSHIRSRSSFGNIMSHPWLFPTYNSATFDFYHRCIKCKQALPVKISLFCSLDGKILLHIWRK